MNKDVSIEIRVTQDEKEVIRHLARMSGLKMSEYIRRKILPVENLDKKVLDLSRQ